MGFGNNSASYQLCKLTTERGFANGQCQGLYNHCMCRGVSGRAGHCPAKPVVKMFNHINAAHQLITTFLAPSQKVCPFELQKFIALEAPTWTAADEGQDLRALLWHHLILVLLHYCVTYVHHLVLIVLGASMLVFLPV